MPHAAEIDRPRHRPRREYAALVEHAVVRQIDLAPNGGDRTAVEQAIGVVELAIVEPGRADQHGGTAIVGLARELFDLGAAGRLQRRLQHQVFRRIATDVEFGKGNQIGAVARGLRPRRARFVGIARDIAEGRIELGDRDGESVDGTGIHGRRCSVAAPRFIAGIAVAWGSGTRAALSRYYAVPQFGGPAMTISPATHLPARDARGGPGRRDQRPPSSASLIVLLLFGGVALWACYSERHCTTAAVQRPGVERKHAAGDHRPGRRRRPKCRAKDADQ